MLTYFLIFQYKIRKEALMGLGQVYRRYMQIEERSETDTEHCQWIRNKILHAYYRNSVEDR